MRLSLEVAALAVALALVPGTLLGYALARGRFRGRALVDALVLLPLVLPPSVIGYLLLVLLGSGGPVGRLTGWHIPFTFPAAVIAATVVALPLFAKTAQAALSQVALDLEELAYTLGMSRVRTFWKVTLPLAWRGLLAATVLAFARALGEFGATLMFAGNLPGRTNTLPLEIYTAYLTGDNERALLLVAILSAFSLGVVLVANRLGRNAL